MSILSDIIDAAVKELDNLQKGERFLLRDLFKGYIWNRVSDGDRRTLGRIFLYEFEKGGLPLEIDGNNNAGQQYYIKK